MRQMGKDGNTLEENKEETINNIDNNKSSECIQKALKEKNAICMSDLSEVEIKYICQQITPKKIRAYFQRYPQEFNKIRSGVRASSLSDDSTIMLVNKNIKKDFVASFIYKKLDVWKWEIEEYFRELEQNGESHEKALLKTISQSVFAGNVGLFFMVLGKQYSEEYIALVENALLILEEKEKFEKSLNENLKDRAEKVAKNSDIIVLKENELANQVTKLRQELENEINTHHQDEKALANLSETNLELKNELISIKAQFKVAQDNVSRLQAELEKIHHLSKYSDEEIEEERSDDYRYTSICQIYTDYSGKKCRRLADIESRKVKQFIKAEEELPYFSNRDKLPLFDGPDTEGFIGVWDWNAVPNHKDPYRDYIRMQYNSSIKYIEVVELSECHSCEELSAFLIANTFSCISNSKVFAGYRITESQISGLLCSTRELEFYDGSARLKKDVYVLPQYTIDVGDILEIGGKHIYRFLNLGIPQSVFQVKSPLEVVKELVVKRATGAKLRQSGLSIKEAQHCRAFLKDLPKETIYQEIVDAYGCTETDAKEYLSTFIEQADSYLTKSDLDMDTLGAAMERNTRLVMKCKELLFEDWKAENSKKIRMAQDELDIVIKSVNEETNIYNTYKEKHDRMKMELEKLQEEISRQEKLARDVEEKIAARIATAKKDAADFISEMAFVIPNDASRGNILPEKDFNDISVTYRKKEYILGDEITDIDSFEEELTDNLSKAGYNDDAALQIAQMIIFAICSKMPIVCSDNAERIADCVSAMFGEEGVCMVTLPIGSSHCKTICDLIGQETKSTTRVFLVNGIFDGFSLNAFHEIRQYSEEWEHNAILIFPLNGINTDMVSSYVWNRTIFIDGDIGVVDFDTNILKSFHTAFDFALKYDEKCDKEEFRKKRKLLKRFYGIIDNTALLNFTKYLVATDGMIEPNEMLLVQIVLSAKANGKKEELLEIFSSIGFDIKLDKYMTKYL